MSRTAIALLALVLALAGAAGGWWAGVSHGQTKQQAQQNAQLVKDLGGIISAHQGLVVASNAASLRMRKTASVRLADDRATTQELSHVLAQTAASRADCVLPAAGLQYLQTARDRAARAAASGLAAELPDAGASAGGR